MEKYAKIVNEETKECNVGLGTDVVYYKSIGFEKMEVEKAWNDKWYVSGYAPEKPAPTYEEIKEKRIEYRKANIDDKTLERQRKTANGSWTDADEEEYLKLDAEVTEWIEKNLPYPEEVKE